MINPCVASPPAFDATPSGTKRDQQRHAVTQARDEGEQIGNGFF
jgi:hypothetical protein